MYRCKCCDELKTTDELVESEREKAESASVMVKTYVCTTCLYGDQSDEPT